jgi:hypothetical protein
MAIVCYPDAPNPTHHIRLSRDGQELGLILVNSAGAADPAAITQDQYPDSATKVSQVGGKFDDSMPPFSKPSQDDWAGGRAQEAFEDDKTRYLDNGRTDPTRRGRVILGAQETYCTGVRNCDQTWSGPVTWYSLLGARRFLSRAFTASASYLVAQGELLLRRVGSPGEVTMAIYTSSGGAPAVKLTWSERQASLLDANGASQVVAFGVGDNLTAGTVYHAVVFAAATDDAENHWEVGGWAAGNAHSSADGATWASGKGSPFFRLTDGEQPAVFHFVEYKNALYAVAQYDDGSPSKLFLNGWRGATDSQGGYLQLLKDATQAWATNGLAGCVARLIGGSAWKKELQSWRKIISNTADVLTVNPAWKVAHNATSVAESYVVLGSSHWTQRYSEGWIDGPAKSVVVANDQLYISPIADVVTAYREYCDGADWKFPVAGSTSNYWRSMASETDGYLEVTRDDYGNKLLWMSVAGGGSERREENVQYVAAPKEWSTYKGPIVVHDCDSIWDEQVIPNVTWARVSDNVLTCSVDAGHTTGLLGSKAVGPLDLRYADRLTFKLQSSIALAAGDLELVLDNTALCASPIVVKSLPAMAAYKPISFDLDLAAESVTGIDAVISVGIRLTVDRGAWQLQVMGPIYARDDKDLIPVTADSRITGLAVYGEPATLWVLSEDGIGEIRNGRYLPAEPGEYATAADENNGRAHAVMDVYLYTSFGPRGGVLRKHDRNLDGIGLDKDEGLPAGRVGPVACLVAYADRLLAAVDAGSDGYSAIYAQAEGGWHEIYRAPRAGLRIRSMHVQTIPGLVDRLWFGQGSDIVWIPISMNPLQESDYRYTHEGYIQLSRVFVKERDVRKFWHALKLTSENLGSSCRMRVEYRVDGSASWTNMDAAFTSSPFQKQTLSPNDDLAGRWIDLRIWLETSDNTKTPVLLGAALDVIEQQPVKWAHTLTARVADQDTDLLGNRDPMGRNAKLALIKSWTDGKPVLVNSVDSLEDGRRMIIKSQAVRKKEWLEGDYGQRLDVVQITLVEYGD